MRHTIAATLLAGTFAAFLPAVAIVAAPAPGAQTGGKHTTTATAATHATTGVVKSIDDSTLVITRSGKRGDITFAVSPETHREGSVAVGSQVSVRYNESGKTFTATAITAQPVKQQAAHK
jgi:hypothetical protein